MSAPSNRNSAGKGTVAFYVVGVVCAVLGFHLAMVTRINLVTGQTSSPYLGLGIPLVAGGILAIVIARRTAKRNLNQ
jgi:lipopolysaccharide export LptBFGC system permease protein LptF